MPQVSSRVPVVSQSNHALSLVFLNETTGATEQTFHITTCSALRLKRASSAEHHYDWRRRSHPSC